MKGHEFEREQGNHGRIAVGERRDGNDVNIVCMWCERSFCIGVAFVA